MCVHIFCTKGSLNNPLKCVLRRERMARKDCHLSSVLLNSLHLIYRLVEKMKYLRTFAGYILNFIVSMKSAEQTLTTFSVVVVEKLTWESGKSNIVDFG